MCCTEILTDKSRRLDSTHDEQSQGYTRVEDTACESVKDGSGRVERETESGGGVKVALSHSQYLVASSSSVTHDDPGCRRGVGLGFTVLIEDIAHTLACLLYASVRLLALSRNIRTHP